MQMGRSELIDYNALVSYETLPLKVLVLTIIYKP